MVYSDSSNVEPAYKNTVVTRGKFLATSYYFLLHACDNSGCGIRGSLKSERKITTFLFGSGSKLAESKSASIQVNFTYPPWGKKQSGPRRVYRTDTTTTTRAPNHGSSFSGTLACHTIGFRTPDCWKAHWEIHLPRNLLNHSASSRRCLPTKNGIEIVALLCVLYTTWCRLVQSCQREDFTCRH